MIPDKGNRIEFVNYETDLTAGDQVKIISEFAPNDRFKSPFVGEIELADGTTRLLGLNWTTYFVLAKGISKDTADWIGHIILYKGKIPIKGKMGQVLGHVWEAVEVVK